MQDRPLSAFETFLIEDVILTLGNLRGALAWLAQPGAGVDPATLRSGLDRLQGQIALLEDRAHKVCRTEPAPRPCSIKPVKAAYTEASSMSLESLLRDALGSDIGMMENGGAQFRSSRKSHG